MWFISTPYIQFKFIQYLTVRAQLFAPNVELNNIKSICRQHILIFRHTVACEKLTHFTCGHNFKNVSIFGMSIFGCQFCPNFSKFFLTQKWSFLNFENILTRMFITTFSGRLKYRPKWKLQNR